MGSKRSSVRQLIELMFLDTISDIQAADIASMKLNFLEEQNRVSGHARLETAEIEKKYTELLTNLKERFIAVTAKNLLEIFSKKEIEELVKIYQSPLAQKFLKATGDNIFWVSEDVAVVEAEFTLEYEAWHHAQYHADKESKN